MTVTERNKEGKAETKKFEYLENEKSFLDVIKNIFHKYLSIVIGWKNEI